jgi:probable rRNA maturation factor
MPAFKIHFFAPSVTISLKHRKKLKAILIQLILQERNIFQSGEVCVIFCDDHYLYSLNTEFLKHDTLTDIITFDYSEGNKIYGDIFISIDRVKENAKTYSQPFRKEMSRVIIHGFLHLCGYKDKETKEKILMTRKENFYLDGFEKIINQANEKNN